MAEGNAQSLGLESQEIAVTDPVAVGSPVISSGSVDRSTTSGLSEQLRAARDVGYEGSRPEVRALVPPQAERVSISAAHPAHWAGPQAEQGVRTVVGVEREPAYAEDARKKLDDVHCLDLNDLPHRGDVLMALGRFDCIVAADVLEHSLSRGLSLICRRNPQARAGPSWSACRMFATGASSAL